MLLPSCAAYASAIDTDRYEDMITPPGLTNHWAVAQVEHDVVAIRSLHVPPVAFGSPTAKLFLGGRLAQSYGQPVTCQWFPDQVQRRTVIDGWEISTVTVCPVGEPAVAVQIFVRNTGDQARKLQLGLYTDSQVAGVRAPWNDAQPPSSTNTHEIAGARRYGYATSPTGRRVAGAEFRVPAVAVQGLVDATGADVSDASGRVHLIELRTTLEPGATWNGTYILAVVHGENLREQADELFARIAGNPDLAGAARAYWDASLAAMFTPGNAEFGGALPVLETSNEDLRRLYWWGAMGVNYFRRDNPASVLGRTYDTLMPANWQTTTFIWDYSLSSQVHALADPGVMRGQIRHWVSLDIDRHFGTEWLTGQPAGYWYSVNQYAMTRLLADYIRYSGDVAFLDEEVSGPDGSVATIGDHVRRWAWSWHDKRRGSELADYGEIDNLLECVSTYVHEVASLNAANVWVMRTAAELSELQGRHDEAGALRAEAERLLPLVNELYVPGKGIFHSRFPDGSVRETRHCYDYATVGTTIAADLPESQRDEMVRFFDTELRTDNWMRALSPFDDDAGYSLRPDHQWNGAYPAWPPDSARATIELGHPEVVAAWLPGLARTANQGPPGQAHFVEEAYPGLAGGARKAPNFWPYITDWACSSAGAFCELVIAGIFGLRVEVDGTVSATPVLEHFDPQARLTGLFIRGREYVVDRHGVHEVAPK